MVDTSSSDVAQTPEETAEIEAAQASLEAAVEATAADDAESDEV
jgi:hypothetical protein